MILHDPRVRRLARRVRLKARRVITAPPPVLGPEATRLVPDPVFVISSIRSGSTLLRVLLNSHPDVRAPHEMHLRTLTLTYSEPYTEKAMGLLDLDQRELEHLLWDRVLHRELVRSEKKVIVDKTPGNADQWQRLHEAWPRARFIFLLRHPASVVASQMDSRPDKGIDWTVRHIRRYVEQVDAARGALDGLTVRYEDLTADPEAECRRLCTFLGVDWTPKMVRYGRQDHGPFQVAMGDWSDKIKSGRVQAPRPLPSPEDVPEPLRAITRKWEYPC
ncbi:sulfotransferase family protein [Streptomyces sp. NBC_00448]|uniref:sulfotransferase family protein n=1 Tax=Streptomyces sp. NBC_00448 TaxID=2903652 RepID=UPI002E225F68